MSLLDLRRVKIHFLSVEKLFNSEGAPDDRVEQGQVSNRVTPLRCKIDEGCKDARS